METLRIKLWQVQRKCFHGEDETDLLLCLGNQIIGSLLACLEAHQLQAPC